MLPDAPLGRAVARGVTQVRARVRVLARAGSNAELQRAKTELQRARAARDRFLVQLVDAQERDAHKVADLLHDDVVQQLTALQFRLELKAQQLDDASIGDLARDSSAMIASIRRLLVELHPAILDSQGLAPAVDVVADSLRDRGIDVRVAPFPHRLPREREVLAYRLVQEALENVMRHSGAAYAEVEFSLDENTLHGRVSDSGRGIPGDGLDADGLGLMVARERVELAGGRFSVRAREPEGTDLVFELPADRSPTEAAA